MGDWNFLGVILEEVHMHSTIVGKIWLTILFIFRMLVLGVAAEDVWNDEQSDFFCNTEQPGCRNVCYDDAFPISLIRYWVLQVIFVSSPSLVYMGHAIYRLRALEKERQKKKAQLRWELEGVEVDMSEARRRLERELRHLEQRKLNKAPLRGSLLCTYIIHIFTRSAVEIGFMFGQYVLYGVKLTPLYKCQKDPCPNIVDCFVSRPTEKTVFILFMQCIAAVSLFLNILEIVHLGIRKIKKGLLGQYKMSQDYDDSKCKKNSVMHHSCIGISASPQKTLPSAPSGYTLLMDKQSDPTVYPILNPPSAFQPIEDDHMEEGRNSTEEENKMHNSVQPVHATERHCQNTSSNNNEGISKIFGPDMNGMQRHEPKRRHCVRSAHSSLESAPGLRMGSQVELASETTGEPSVQNMTPTVPRNLVRKPRRISAPWNCSTVVEGRDITTDADFMSSIHRRYNFSSGPPCAPSKTELKRTSRPDTPESLGDLSSESKNSRSCDSPQAFPSSRRMSLASNASSRRATTDLQI
ncbi:gap junction alpha-9 protein [Ambystoma mexicanum]|uniref:gap junction alpha-9 protein n=1 Tax=Ambystoma mexicanum TaxID=8296 RepID=UPI0037E7E98E